MLLEGIFAAVTTPFYPDERLYFRKLEANMAHYSRSLLAGMLVLGSTGEAVLVDDRESADILRCAADAAAPEKVLIAGISRESVRATLAQADVAAEVRYDAVLVRPPSYYAAQMSPAVVLNYFRAVADRSPLPVLLYNIPQCAGYDLPVELVAELAGHPNIVGLKESGGKAGRIAELAAATRLSPRRTVTVTPVFEAVTARMLVSKSEPTGSPEPTGSFIAAGDLAGGTAVAAAPPAPALKTRSKEVGFQVLCGSGAAVFESLESGASGAILAFAACAPQAATEIYLAWKDHDLNLAREKQQRIASANRAIVAEKGIPGLKYACDFNGYYGGRARRPFVNVTREERSQIERLLETIRS